MLYRHNIKSWAFSTLRNFSGKEKLKDGPDLKNFLRSPPNRASFISEIPPYLNSYSLNGRNRKVFFDVLGCQMNVSDTEIVWSLLKSFGYVRTKEVKEADVILIVTCAIRDNAETKAWNKLFHYTALKKKRQADVSKPPIKIGLLGCMAERLKHQLIEREKCVDVIAGPDSYKDLPRLLSIAENGRVAINVALSLDETYADVVPVRLERNSISAYVSIMRGCDNMCTYCIVPFTRGKERSRPIDSILQEVEELSSQGVKEITLLGQNVNSYRDTSVNINDIGTVVEGFKTVYKAKKGGLRFASLLDKVSRIDSNIRIRFTSPHPKDFPDEVLSVIDNRPNVCCNIHLPAQSGSSTVLERMRRGYTRDAYLNLVSHIRKIIPKVTLSSDFICGFCGETEEEFRETLSLIREVKYHTAFLFAYSMREKTTAHRRFTDDIPEAVKKHRLVQMIDAFREEAEALNKKYVGSQELILVESVSKRSKAFLAGRNDGNVKIIIPLKEIPLEHGEEEKRKPKPGDYVRVLVTDSNSQGLKGKPLCISSS